MAIGYHIVQPGDALFRILRDTYGATRFLQEKDQMLAYVKANNPHIEDVNRIFPGQVIMLPVEGDPSALICVADQPPSPMAPAQATSAAELATELTAMTSAEYGVVKTFGQKVVDNAAGTFVEQVGKAATQSRFAMEKIVRDYYTMQSGQMTRGQYNYARNVQIAQIQGKMGVLEPLFINKSGAQASSARQVLRIDRTAAVRPHQHLDQIRNMRGIAKTAKIGGRVLKGISLASAGFEFSQARTKADRIGIVADVAGGLAGAALAVVIVGTPAGWVGIALVFAAGTVGGIAGGTTAETLAEGWLADNWKTPIQQFLD